MSAGIMVFCVKMTVRLLLHMSVEIVKTIR
jgi:hypothetical protein